MKTLGQQIKHARQQRHMSQSALAKTVGCKQSALSMYEGGRTTALNSTVIQALCQLLDLVPPTASELNEVVVSHTPVRSYCPNPNCPSNLAVAIDGQPMLVPHRHLAGEDELHCAWCGEVLEKACPSCGAPINAGAYCAHCGEAYLADLPERIEPARIEQSRQLMAWSE